jgi:hypothetical protein
MAWQEGVKLLLLGWLPGSERCLRMAKEVMERTSLVSGKQNV